MECVRAYHGCTRHFHAAGSRVDYRDEDGRLYAIAHLNAQGVVFLKQHLDADEQVVAEWRKGKDGNLMEWEEAAQETAQAVAEMMQAYPNAQQVLQEAMKAALA